MKDPRTFDDSLMWFVQFKNEENPQLQSFNAHRDVCDRLNDLDAKATAYHDMLVYEIEQNDDHAGTLRTQSMLWENRAKSANQEIVELKEKISKLEEENQKNLPSTTKVCTFYVNHPGEPSAGIRPFSDVIGVHIASGDPGGEVGEFAEEILTTLREWFDGAQVKYTRY